MSSTVLSALTEKDDPVVTDELVEVNRTLGGLGLEVRGNGAEAKTAGPMR